MKIGLISDIHANLVNLRRAFVILRQHGAEAILCAGDLVDGETEGEAAARFFRQQNIPAVQGNHDRLMSDPALAGIATRFPPRSGVPPTPEQLHDDELTSETVAYLWNLPRSLRFEWDRRRLLLTHACTWDQGTYVFADQHPEYLQRIVAEAEADVIILGHTHTPMAVEVAGTWLFNPGSVYSGRDAPYTPTCATLDLPEMHFQVYDIDTGRPVQHRRTRLN